MTLIDIVAALLWAVVCVYAVTGGADFGGGVWDLFAGGTQRGAGPRTLIERSIAPVWEANHVWLVIVLVVLWTAFPTAFGPLMTTLFIPLSAAVFGILLRGSGFAVRHAIISPRYQQLSGATFALSSLITPFFFGTAAGAIVTGRVPASGSGNRLTSWTTPTALTIGLLSVTAFAYLAAVYLTADARRLEPGLVGYFARRATASAMAVGVLAGVTLWELEGSAPRIAATLTTGAGLPLLITSVALGSAVLAGLVTHHTNWLRYLAAGAFVTMLWGWAVSQYPAMLPPSLGLRQAAAPQAALMAEIIVVGVITALVIPSFVLLYHLTQRDLLGDHESGAAQLARSQSGSDEPPAAGPPAAAASD